VGCAERVGARAARRCRGRLVAQWTAGEQVRVRNAEQSRWAACAAARLHAKSPRRRAARPEGRPTRCGIAAVAADHDYVRRRRRRRSTRPGAPPSAAPLDPKGYRPSFSAPVPNKRAASPLRPPSALCSPPCNYSIGLLALPPLPLRSADRPHSTLYSLRTPLCLPSSSYNCCLLHVNPLSLRRRL